MERLDRAAPPTETEELMVLLEKCPPEQKNYIAGVIAGMNAERKLSAQQKPA